MLINTYSYSVIISGLFPKKIDFDTYAAAVAFRDGLPGKKAKKAKIQRHEKVTYTQQKPFSFWDRVYIDSL